MNSLTPQSSAIGPPPTALRPAIPVVALLTAGRDRPYALGLASALISSGLTFDFIGSDLVDSPELHGNVQVNYLNLRSQHAGVGLLQKMTRVLAYYFRLMGYAVTARPRIFHILWNNKFEVLDRTVLMAFYKLLGKKIILTAHNVNAGVRDGKDSFLNRLSLKIQYRWSDHIFVHTDKMKAELAAQFGVPGGKVSVIPFGINNTVPDTELTTEGARRRLGIKEGEKVMLFFGNITPYKGLEYLVTAFIELNKCVQSQNDAVAGGRSGDASPQKAGATPSSRKRTGTSFGVTAGSGDEASPTPSATGASQLRTPSLCSATSSFRLSHQPSTANHQPTTYRLIIAGRPKDGADYWNRLQKLISSSGMGERVIHRIEYVPDEQTELYFKAADVLVLPYTEIFQSGVLFLGYSFGLPVIASDVGSLKEEISEGKTGFMFRPQNAADLADTVKKYFASELYQNLGRNRQAIRQYANERYSWNKVAAITTKVYAELIEN